MTVTDDGMDPLAAGALEAHVRVLAQQIGERNLRDAARGRALAAARDYIADALARTGRGVRMLPYVAADQEVANVELEVPGDGRGDEIVVLGAHYDSAHQAPGANDNATGVAGLLGIARALTSGPWRPRRTLRFVAFSTEEPPFTRTRDMGSLVYARQCRARADNITAMLGLEGIGYFARGHRPREAPFPLRLVTPWRSDFIALIGNLASRGLVERVHAAYDGRPGVPCVAAALPGVLRGVRSSDQWSFWKQGYRAAMFTDTAWLRYRHFRRATDTPDKLDFRRLAAVSRGIMSAVRALAGTARRAR